MAEFPDALVEQAAQAIFDTYGQRDTDRSRRLARAVLEAVAPAIAAQALRDAGREWAEGAWQDAYAAFPVEDDISSVQAAEKWLNERADQIEKEDRCIGALFHALSDEFGACCASDMIPPDLYAAVESIVAARHVTRIVREYQPGEGT